ncbi:MAG TPA: hypothetical protein PLI44_08390 [Chiayiivirga sp.]|nr:hypothetical protein [Chiayiivirga sp.]
MSRKPPAQDPSQLKHESAVGHVTGRAVYTDEQHPPQGLLSVWPVTSPHAHARVLRIDVAQALAVPGVATVLTAADIPGENDSGTILHDEPVIADDVVSFHGQSVAWVVARDEATARAAAERVRVEYEPLPPILTITCRPRRSCAATWKPHWPPRRWYCTANCTSAGRSTSIWKPRPAGPAWIRKAWCR